VQTFYNGVFLSGGLENKEIGESCIVQRNLEACSVLSRVECACFDSRANFRGTFGLRAATVGYEKRNRWLNVFTVVKA